MNDPLAVAVYGVSTPFAVNDCATLPVPVHIPWTFPPTGRMKGAWPTRAKPLMPAPDKSRRAPTTPTPMPATRRGATPGAPAMETGAMAAPGKQHLCT